MPPALRFRIPAAGALAATALSAGLARAADYALRVEAPAGCADEPRLFEAIRGHSPGFAPADWDARGATRFVVRFLPRDADVVVEIETTDASGARSLRSIPAQDCPEAVRASAWILALLVDPTAANAEPAPPIATATREVAPAAISPTPSAASPVEPAASPAATAIPPAAAAAPPADEDAAPGALGAPLAKKWPWQLSIGGFGGVLQSALPETPLGLGVFVEGAWERESWFRPAARLAGLDAGSGVSRTERGDVVVGFVGGRLSLCPLRSSRAQLMSVRFCGLMEIGRLSGEGQNTTDQGSATPTWYAAGSAFGLELQPWSFLAIELEGALLFPFNRDRFVFEPEPVQAGYEVPPISASLALGIAWRSGENKQQYLNTTTKGAAGLIPQSARGH